MKKQLFLALLLAASLFSCSSSNGGEQIVNPDNSNVITLNKESVTLDYFDTYQIKAKTTKAGTVLYSSSDNSVARVNDNGVITTYRQSGKAVITASLGRYKATMDVNIEYSGALPELDLQYRSITIEKGSSFLFTYDLSYNGKDLVEEIVPECSFDVDGICTISEGSELNSFSLYASSIGHTNLSIYTIFDTQIVSKTLSIEVAPKTLTIFSSDFDADKDAYHTDLYLYSEDPNKKSSFNISSFRVFDGNNEITNASLTYEIEDTSIATIDNKGNVKGVTMGETVLKVSYGSSYAKVNISVKKDTLHYNRTLVIDRSVENAICFKEDNLVGTSILGFWMGKNNTSLYLKENFTKSTNTLVLNNDAIPTSASELTYQKIVIETDRAYYEGNAYFFSIIVRTTNDLRRINAATLVGKDRWDGYILLMNDIDINGMNDSIFQGSYDRNIDGFCGVFDGNGYSLYNYETKGISKNLFGSKLGRAGIIQNLKMDNIRLNHNKANSLFAYSQGTYSNMYIGVTAVSSDNHGSATVSNWMDGNNVTFSGLFIDYSKCGPLTTVGESNGFMPVSYQHASGKFICVVDGTYNASDKSVIYKDIETMNEDLEKISTFMLSPYWEIGETLSFAGYHSYSF